MLVRRRRLRPGVLRARERTPGRVASLSACLLATLACGTPGGPDEPIMLADDPGETCRGPGGEAACLPVETAGDQALTADRETRCDQPGAARLALAWLRTIEPEGCLITPCMAYVGNALRSNPDGITVTTSAFAPLPGRRHNEERVVRLASGGEDMEVLFEHRWIGALGSYPDEFWTMGVRGERAVRMRVATVEDSTQLELDWLHMPSGRRQPWVVRAGIRTVSLAHVDDAGVATLLMDLGTDEGPSSWVLARYDGAGALLSNRPTRLAGAAAEPRAWGAAVSAEATWVSLGSTEGDAALARFPHDGAPAEAWAVGGNIDRAPTAASDGGVFVSMGPRMTSSLTEVRSWVQKIMPDGTSPFQVSYPEEFWPVLSSDGEGGLFLAVQASAAAPQPLYHVDDRGDCRAVEIEAPAGSCLEDTEPCLQGSFTLHPSAPAGSFFVVGSRAVGLGTLEVTP